MQKDQQFLEFVVKSLVNHPEDVKTDREIDDRGVKITLHVNPEDMGYIIGRQGQTARALRILLKIVGAKDDARVSMVIFEPEEQRRQHQEMKASMPASAPVAGGVPSRPAAPRVHGDAGLVSDDDLSDLGI
ncbi:MAG: KH domain-containing protein [Candidatus Uhrbacteria bacterium]